MSRFIAGALFGCLLAIVGSAFAAVNVAGSGTLEGWTVLDEDGDELCTNPEVDAGKKVIKCPRPTLIRAVVPQPPSDGRLGI
jgi:hypothetical protein